MVTWDIEVTDTFGGQANYSWVERSKLRVPDDISDLALVRRIKSAAGYSGIRGRTWVAGDSVEIRFPALRVVIFANVRY